MLRHRFPILKMLIDVGRGSYKNKINLFFHLTERMKSYSWVDNNRLQFSSFFKLSLEQQAGRSHIKYLGDKVQADGLGPLSCPRTWVMFCTKPVCCISSPDRWPSPSLLSTQSTSPCPGIPTLHLQVILMKMERLDQVSINVLNVCIDTVAGKILFAFLILL